MFQDLRYALKTLRRTRGFAAMAILTIAVAIAVNTIVFTLLNSLALRPMPVREASRVVRLYPMLPDGTRANLFSYPDYLEYRASARALDGLVAYIPVEISVQAGTGAETRTALGYAVSRNYFGVLGIPLSMGGIWSDDEERAGGAVAVIGHAFWERQYGSDPAVIGRNVVVNGRRFRVVGVGPKKFYGTEPLVPDVWVPLTAQPTVLPGPALLADRGTAWLLLLARLRNGATFESASEWATVVARRLAAGYPSASAATSVTVAAGTFFTLDPSLWPLIELVLGTAGLVLAIASANVASLFLSRFLSRRHELALRMAIGATRTRVVCLLLTETLVVGLLGGGAGLLLSHWILQILYPVGVALLPFEWSTALDLSPDIRVVAYTFALAGGASLAFGLSPALQVSDRRLKPALHDDRSGFSGRPGNLHSALVVLQVAVSLVLLVATGLLGRAVQHAEALDLGFNAHGVLYVDCDLRRAAYSASRADAFVSGLIQTAEALPGVSSVGLTSHVPLTGGLTRTRIALGASATTTSAPAIYAFVTPGYFDALGMPIVRGRNFPEGDAAGLAIISEGLAEQFWPGRNPVGERLTVPESAVPLTVIGEVRDASNSAIWRQKEFALYLPRTASTDAHTLKLVVRSTGSLGAVTAALRGRARSMDPALAVRAVPLEEVLRLWILPSRVAAVSALVLGAIALMLAASGGYAVLAHAVARRTREIGIRLALGARRVEIMRLILSDGGRLIAIGICGGSVATASTTWLLRGFIFGVSPFDPRAFVGGAVVVGLAGLAACYLPARHATRVDPMVALRAE